jgi:hypothetical protein
MGTPLTAAEAYLAGRDDFDSAVVEAATNPFVEGDFRAALKLALCARWQDRIDSGQLPPLLEKAS